MKERCLNMRTIIFSFLMTIGGVFGLQAEEPKTPEPQFLPTTAGEAQWTFSGVVSDEAGEAYGYFFQMVRRGEQFLSRSALFDVETKRVLIQDESEAALSHDAAQSNHFHIGHAFLQYNPINGSWVFGIKKADKTGFNFKVYMLKPAEKLPVAEGLKAGIDVLVSQAHELNGHVYLPDGPKETFVTAKSAWFRQIAVTDTLNGSHAVKGILCRFNDDTGFYSINLPEIDAIKGAIAGRFNAEGQSVPVSQFINVEALKSGDWMIHLLSPEQKIVLTNLLKDSPFIAGIAEQGGQRGFCVLSEDGLGQQLNQEARTDKDTV